MLARHLGFQRVIFDCGMTLLWVEGLDELALLKGRAAVAEEAAVFLEGPGLAGLLPIALYSYGLTTLAGKSFLDIFHDGVRAIESGQILFKDDAYRQRVLYAHNGATNPKQVFGE